MFSIVVCSIKQKLLNNLIGSINNTIGPVPFELIQIDNRIRKIPIAKAYNEGIEKAKFPFLVFVHEDIFFHTQNWGEILLNYFESDKKIGLLGVAGTKIKTDIPSSWWENERENQVMNIIQHFPNNRTEKILFGFTEEPLTEVVSIDGVFIAMRKNKIRFDERIEGFHNYDQSISLRSRKAGYKNFVTNEIVIEHFSIGNKDRSWLNSNIKLNQLYQEELPQSVSGNKISKNQKAYTYFRLYHNYKGFGDKRNAILNFLRFLYFQSFTRKDFRLIKEFLIWSIKR